MKRQPGAWGRPVAVVERGQARLTLCGQTLPPETPLYSLDLLQLRATLEAAKTEIGKRGGSVGILAIIEVALEKL